MRVGTAFMRRDFVRGLGDGGRQNTPSNLHLTYCGIRECTILKKHTKKTKYSILHKIIIPNGTFISL